MRVRARLRVRMKDIRSAAPFVLLGLAFVLTLVLQKSFLVQSDEGYTLNAAWQMWNGMKMYDDFRLFVAPGAGCSVYAVLGDVRRARASCRRACCRCCCRSRRLSRCT